MSTVKKTTQARKPKAKAKKSTTATQAKTKPCIMVTGANGALARKTIDLLQKDYKIVAVDFRARALLGQNIDSYKIDFNKRELDQLFAKYTFDAVIHLGRVSVHQLHKKARYAANVLGTKKLLDLCVKYDVSNVLVLSTFHVYGAHPYNPAMINEDSPLKASELTMDLLDSVELENLCNVYLWKHPQLNLTTLRPCNIVGPGINNTISRLLKHKLPGILIGFSPMMQFIHMADMAEAIKVSFQKNIAGIYNVAPDDWVGYRAAIRACGGTPRPILSIPESLSKRRMRSIGKAGVPSYLYNFFKYPVVIDGALFRETFGFEQKYELKEIFSHYKELK